MYTQNHGKTRYYLTKLLAIVSLLVLMVGIVTPAVPVRADPGVDGSLTVSAAGTVLNRYAVLTGIAGNVVSVDDITRLADGGSGHYTNAALSAGDMILIYQAQGASFTDNSDAASYGTFDVNSAGAYEFAVVVSVAGNDITVNAAGSPPYACGGISNTYDLTGNVQVVRVPQYTDLTIDGTGEVTAPAWDGATGGIVVLVVEGAMTINGSVNASGLGFRGGVIDNLTLTDNITVYVNAGEQYGAEKGESILGYQAVYDNNNGRYSRGAPANGGGGGDAHNAGGGGGANGDNGGTWNGSGIPDTSGVNWTTAWDLDDGANDGSIPAYFFGGAGGGRGGYTFAWNDQDALTVPPGDTSWSGDDRRQVGGLGGRPLPNDPAVQVFFGGGGGSGDGNSGSAGGGGEGGGLVILTANTVSGTGAIYADGANGYDTYNTHNDAAGGGGGGGSVVIQADTVADVSISADGGIGGNQLITNNESEGPGGGGGGGFVALDANNGTLTLSVVGGANGATTSTGVSEFPPNGATQGYEGATLTTVDDGFSFQFPGCTTPTAISLTQFSAQGDHRLALWMGAGSLLLVSTGALLLYHRRQENA